MELHIRYIRVVVGDGCGHISRLKNSEKICHLSSVSTTCIEYDRVMESFFPFGNRIKMHYLVLYTHVSKWYFYKI